MKNYAFSSRFEVVLGEIWIDLLLQGPRAQERKLCRHGFDSYQHTSDILAKGMSYLSQRECTVRKKSLKDLHQRSISADWLRGSPITHSEEATGGEHNSCKKLEGKGRELGGNLAVDRGSLKIGTNFSFKR